jgi:predicted acyltransferase
MATLLLSNHHRLTSLDAFRGATMAFMVLVNNPGNGDATYAPLQHASWDGWTPTDVVFPSFVWIVGVALTLSLGKKLESGGAPADLLAQAAKRAAIIFLLGLSVYAFPHFDPATFRILGVLQRIAVCYLITAAIYLHTSWRGQVATIVSLFAAYAALMFFGPVPGYGSGHLDVERNFAHYIDKTVLGAHNYAQTRTWDPEGIVSTLPAIASMLLGVMAGHILAWKSSLAEKVKYLLLCGVVLLAMGYLVDLSMPINKKLWSNSFTLVMAGLDFLLFAGFLWVADLKGYRKIFTPFVMIGMNAITVYMASEILDTMASMFEWKKALYMAFTGFLAPVDASLLYALLYVLLMFSIAWVLYRRRIFIRA